MKSLKLCVFSLLAFSAVCHGQNVVLIVGDGMDDQQITAARNYLYGAQGHTILDQMPVRGAVQVLTVTDADPHMSVYVADSANSATAMATGTVTSIGRISTSAAQDTDLTTIAQLAKQQAYKTGLVTTASLTDATPAAFASHVSMRGCEGPEQMVKFESYGDYVIDCAQDTKAQGGKGSIAEQLAASEVDVLLGGGHKFFKQTAEGSTDTIYEMAAKNGFAIRRSLSEAQQTPSNQKLLGVFAKKHLPVRMQGTDGRIAEDPQYSFLHWFHRYLGTVTLPEEMQCESNPEFINEHTPNLADMTELALTRLQNDKGFFLMVESASIDKQSHTRNPCGSIGEAEQLFEVVDRVLAFAQQQPDTLIMITADHGQAAQIIPDGSMFAAYGVPIATPGKMARIRTKEGAIMAINYATNEFGYEEHTGVNVPFFANKQVANVFENGAVPALIKQTDIFEIAKRYLNL